MTVSNQLDRRFRAAAAASGDLDVHYDLLDTPVGPLLVGATDRGLCRIWFDPEPDRFAEDVAKTHGLRVLRVAGSVDDARRQLDQYFERRRPTQADPPAPTHEDGRPAYAELEHLSADLPPTERAAVVLRYGYDLAYSDIALALGSTEDAARQAASAGVRRLRRKELR